uniref:Fibrinogen- and Ig-binding protein-like n=1 Tax=Nicotiana tabacum TaxID=4097 RepID=A0A1S4C4C4_TOBAC|nr:PREDICTED: fibrinogen- and Ig-binding protein-like [Nicotiana tabacum]
MARAKSLSGRRLKMPPTVMSNRRIAKPVRKITEEINALKLLSGQKEGEIKDLQAELATAYKEQTDLIEQVQQKAEKIDQLCEEDNMMKAETLGWKQNIDRLASKKDTARAQLSSIGHQLQSMKEESLAQAQKIEELEARLAAELAKATFEMKKLKADMEVAEHSKYHSRRENLEEIHARGFNLAVDIENAKVLKAEAKALVSFDDDDSGSTSGPESVGDSDDEDAAPKEN